MACYRDSFTFHLLISTANYSTRYIYELGTTSVVSWSEFLPTDPEVRVRFPALPDFLISSESVMEFTQPREYN
jgi:hypothetical protein